MAQQDNVNAGIIAVVGFGGVVLTFASILWLQGYYAKTQRAEDSRKADSIQRKEYNVLRDGQLAHINKDQAIDRAMTRVTQQLQGNPGAATPPQPASAVPAAQAAPGQAAPMGAAGTAPVGGATDPVPAASPPAPPAHNQVQP